MSKQEDKSVLKAPYSSVAPSTSHQVQSNFEGAKTTPRSVNLQSDLAIGLPDISGGRVNIFINSNNNNIPWVIAGIPHDDKIKVRSNGKSQPQGPIDHKVLTFDEKDTPQVYNAIRKLEKQLKSATQDQKSLDQFRLDAEALQINNQPVFNKALADRNITDISIRENAEEFPPIPGSETLVATQLVNPKADDKPDERFTTAIEYVCHGEMKQETVFNSLSSRIALNEACLNIFKLAIGLGIFAKPDQPIDVTKAAKNLEAIKDFIPTAIKILQDYVTSLENNSNNEKLLKILENLHAAFLAAGNCAQNALIRFNELSNEAKPEFLKKVVQYFYLLTAAGAIGDYSEIPSYVLIPLPELFARLPSSVVVGDVLLPIRSEFVVAGDARKNALLELAKNKGGLLGFKGQMKEFANAPSELRGLLLAFGNQGATLSALIAATSAHTVNLEKQLDASKKALIASEARIKALEGSLPGAKPTPVTSEPASKKQKTENDVNAALTGSNSGGSTPATFRAQQQPSQGQSSASNNSTPSATPANSI